MCSLVGSISEPLVTGRIGFVTYLDESNNFSFVGLVGLMFYKLGTALLMFSKLSVHLRSGALFSTYNPTLEACTTRDVLKMCDDKGIIQVYRSLQTP